jgi:zinc/manganese transport system substrate-binding protein
MLTRRLMLAFAVAFALPFPALAEGSGKLKVIASFSVLGDIVSQVGGGRIDLVTLVGPDGDAHVFQPSPADAEAVAGAAVLVVNGLGFEGWMERLIEASGTRAVVVTASEGVTPIDFVAGAEDHDHDHGTFDPHAWQNAANVLIYIANIERGLAAADPEGAATYKANAAAYAAQVQAVDAEIRAAIASLPEDRRNIVTSHDAFGYFAAAYGLTVLAPQGISTEAEASARDVAALITQIRTQKIGAVFVENIADPRLLEQIAAETGARIGGTLYSDALSGPDGPAATYLDMMRNNISQLVAALTPAG